MGKKKVKAHTKPAIKNKPKVKTRKKKDKKVPPSGKVFITATFNNTLITFTDLKGNTIAWGSTGSAGFKGTRKSTPFAASTATQNAAKEALELGLKEIHVYVKGPGMGREGAIRALKSAGLLIKGISDITPIPHNGCRPKKRRRV